MDERLAKAIEILRQSVRQTAQGNETETTTMTNVATVNATYTRLSTGDWGLRANGPLATGQVVRVTTRDGRSKMETVGAIVFANAGVTVAAKASTQPVTPVQPVTPIAPPAARVEPDALARIIIDLETALAGLKALQRAA